MENSVGKRKLGQFVVNDVIIPPLNQEELADGWRMVLPKTKSSTKQHFFNIYLSHLPEHLWERLNAKKTYKSEENVTYYNAIIDRIYTYNVKVSEYDNLLFELFNVVTSKYPNIEQVKNLVENLEQQRVKGWLMIRAKRLL
jgi:hypothetical protein